MPNISTHQVVDQGGEARELRVAQGVVPEGEAHDPCICVNVWVRVSGWVSKGPLKPADVQPAGKLSARSHQYRRIYIWYAY